MRTKLHKLSQYSYNSDFLFSKADLGISNMFFDLALDF